MRYEVVDDELVIQDDSRRILWRGKPEGYVVRWAAAVPESDDGLVLYYFYRPELRNQPFKNLVRVRSDGSIVWHADLPERHDKYTNAQLEGGNLTGWSGQGFTVQLDIDTGRILEQLFTK